MRVVTFIISSSHKEGGDAGCCWKHFTVINSVEVCASEHNKLHLSCMYSQVHSFTSMTVENHCLCPIYAGPLFYLALFEE